MHRYSTALLVGTLTLCGTSIQADVVTLIDEAFTGGAAPTNTAFASWSDSDASAGFETYNSGGAGPRGMSGTYDHDQDGGTANINIPGGIEVNDDAGPVTLTTVLDLTSLSGLSIQDSTLNFFAGRRGTGGTAPTITILNTTDSTTVLAATSITTTGSTWAFNGFADLLDDEDAGDILEILWYGGGSNSSSGLQLADIELTATTVIPEPSSLALLGLGGLLVARRRRS